MADPERPFDVLVDGGIPVVLPSGATHYVLTDAEKAYLEDNISRYIDQNHFVNISDELDIDKLVVNEMFIHRWTMWVSRGKDYWDEDINVKQYADLANDYQTEVRQLKRALGVDKSTRDRQRGDDSVPAYWDSLLRRAKEFGYMRNKQFNQALESMQRIKAIIIFHENADPTERAEFHVELPDVVEVIKDEIRKFDVVDEEFRHTTQKMWVRKQ